MIFIDDDILTTPSFITEHYIIQQQQPGLVHGCLRELIGVIRASDPSKGGIGGKPLNPDKISSKGFSTQGYRLIANALELTIEKMFDGRLPKIAPWLAGVGASISLPKKIWEDAKGYNEDFGTTWGCEDLEFALRLYDQGVLISLAPKAIGVHLSHERINRWEEHEINFQRFIKLHPRPEVISLPALLGPGGSPDCYMKKIREFSEISD